MRVCLVGCGPSAPQYAAEIDASNVVIRCGAFPPGLAGGKWDIWASSFTSLKCEEISAAGMIPGPGKQPIDISGVKASGIWVLGDRPELRIKAAGKRVLSTGKNWLRKFKGRHPASEGMLALRLVMEKFPGEVITIVGFDARSPGKPGWGPIGDREWVARPGHDFVQEKRILAALEASGEIEWWKMK